MSITTGTFPGVRIVDMPDLGAVTDNSSVVGEHAGSGRFNVAQIRGYTGDNARSIKWYGARGDGATDDTAAVQAALNAGVDLHAPPGTYMVGTLNVPSGTVLTGAGRGATVFRRINNAPNDGLFSLASNANDVELTSFTLDGNRANNTHGFLLTGTNCANLFVRDVMFQNDAKTAAYFVTLNPSGGNQTALLSGCEVNACGAGGFTFSGARTSPSRIVCSPPAAPPAFSSTRWPATPSPSRTTSSSPTPVTVWRSRAWSAARLSF